MLSQSVLAGEMSSAGIASDIFHVIHPFILRKKGIPVNQNVLISQF